MRYSVQILYIKYIVVDADSEKDAEREAKLKFEEKFYVETGSSHFGIGDLTFTATDEWEHGKEDDL